MSLILDALNRADREHNADAQTNFSLAENASNSDIRNPFKQWIFIGFFITGILITLLYFQFTTDDDSESIVSENKVSAELIPINNSETVNNNTVTVPNTITEVEVESVTNTNHKPSSKLAVANNQAEVAALYQQSSIAITNTPTTKTPTTKKEPPKATTIEEPQAVVTPAKDTSQQILASIPLLSTMSSRFQTSVPNINYSVHVYNEELGNGVVNLNNGMRRTGDSFSDGIRVIAILNDSVVLEYRGRQFRLPALNSWINFK